jgi:tetratricopeptide (TPR) repeat protein/tRNA A-37 threonylcarbamoyl transferase component Bud32
MSRQLSTVHYHADLNQFPPRIIVNAPDYSRVYHIFRGALHLDTGVRRAFLETACEDQAVRAEVEALLDWHETEAKASEDKIGKVVQDAVDGLIPESIDEFRIDGVLGAGGMGVVYRALQENPHRPVALKVLHQVNSDALNSRFRQESETLGRLRHRGIAQIYSAGTAEAASGSLSYFVMELVEGPDLMTYRETIGLETDGILRLTAEICDAVHYAHGEGVIHRDLKPGNILVDRDGVPRILDFGVARLIDHDAETMTEDGVVIGTVAYMSPEQATGKKGNIGPWSDVYSIGVILYEMLAGRRPIELKGVAIPEALALIEEADPVPLERLETRFSGDISVIVGKALAREPERRYASAAELAADIRRFLAHEPIVARPPSTFYQVSRFVRRHRLAVAMVAVLAIAAPVVTGLGAFIWARLPDLRAHEETLAERRLQDELEEAFHDFHEKRIQEAAGRFQSIRAEFPDSKEAFAGETFARYYLNEDDQVLSLVAEGERLFPGSGTLKKIRADVQRRAGKEDEAASLLLEAGEPTTAADWFIEGYRNIVQARLASARTAAGQDSYRLAEENLVRAIAASSAPRRAYYFALAEAIANQDKPRLNLDLHKVLVARWPDSDRAWWWAGFVSTRSESDKALSYYEEFLRRRPGDFEAHNNLGNVLRNLGRDQDAKLQYQEAFRLNPTHIHPRFNLARIAEAEGDLQGARVVYTTLTLEYPDDGRSHADLAGVYHKLGLFDKAYTLVKKAIEIDPRLVGSHLNHAIIACSLKKYDEALAAVREAIALNPSSGHSHSVHADILRAMDRVDEEFSALELAIRLDPSDSESHSNLAVWYLRKQRWAEAEAPARRAIEIDATRTAPFLNLGACLSNLGRVEEAFACFKRCVEIDPNHAEGRKEFNNHGRLLRAAAGRHEIDVPQPVTDETIRALMKRGMTADRIGQYGTAAELFLCVTQLRPRNLRAFDMLGQNLMLMSQFEPALAAHEAALKIKADDLANGYGRAGVLNRMKRYQESADAYRELIRLHPHHPESHCNLGGLLQGLGHYEESLAMYRRGHELGIATKNWRFPSENWVEKSVLYVTQRLAESGKRPRALEILDEYIDLFPRRKKLQERRKQFLQAQQSQD